MPIYFLYYVLQLHFRARHLFILWTFLALHISSLEYISGLQLVFQTHSYNWGAHEKVVGAVASQLKNQLDPWWSVMGLPYGL